MNASVITKVDPSQVGLLRECLLWVLLASGEQKITVEEVFDAYNGVYTEADVSWERKPQTAQTIRFYKKLLPQAVFSFLKVHDTTGEISLHNPAILHDSFMVKNAEDRPPEPDSTCEICKAHAIAGSRLVFTEREGHLEIATKIRKSGVESPTLIAADALDV